MNAGVVSQGFSEVLTRDDHQTPTLDEAPAEFLTQCQLGLTLSVMNSYYWNTHTRETRWQIDDALKPANDRTKRKSEEFQSSNLVLGEAASSGTEQPSVSADPNNTPRKFK